ncbi:MAG: nucleotidyltransferase family protein [Gammaproteobacteria bacterium]|nr:nucleotidyltransferase family protein [Gammaproteobacteria bacterium]
MERKQVFAIVLAAGAARRFRATKQLADYCGEPLVRRAVRLAETVCAQRSILVTGSNWQRVHDACTPLKGFFVRNEAFENGMGRSIACGVRAVAGTADAVLLLLADQPLISASYLQQMIDAWNGSDVRIVCSEFAGVVGPPVIFPAAYFDELGCLDGDKGARVLMDTHHEQVVALPCEAAATDIDTRDDLIESQS